ncbi:hypothetical protein MTR_7g078980 [Medicago truncatula]|uniref:Uncharacterized protein n=1 Tax=Medicago truncatula TaxID=3880 RepID=G7L6N6_MEDTR|nr:hypothetical protein MTR_7g078980 [Medicago truncatula]
MESRVYSFQTEFKFKSYWPNLLKNTSFFVKVIDASEHAKTMEILYELLNNFIEIGEQGGISLLGYIYNHTSSLNLMRKKTINVELVRHGVTSFATKFLTLQRLPKLKSKLR